MWWVEEKQTEKISRNLNIQPAKLKKNHSIEQRK